ncbi:uncharacterized protein LOC119990075 isoform X2 [Tripterygium wilfordii]|uniref:uncharacterized protein LOC119990075 isoform X2 n=1 Tax=Tripterygium wilfordii TaxID=458696 RepID=UPI0018F823D9|nr:uncharacterized protein LOC119990075 isoform X2 [Tripterygium wilfordii]
MEEHSFVSKAKTAFHSAAAKAERVFTDLKLDLESPKESKKQFEEESPKSDNDPKDKHKGKHLDWRPAHIGTKKDWQDKLKNFKIGKRGVEDTEKVENPNMAVLVYDENLYLLNMKNDLEAKGSQVVAVLEQLNGTRMDTIPPMPVIKQLAIAIDAGKKFKSMKDLLASTANSSPVRERAGLSLAAVKSLLTRDKEDKLTQEFDRDEKVLSLIHLLFDAEGNFLKRKLDSGSGDFTTTSSFPRDIHGAPPESFVVKLAEVTGSFKTLHKMALFWCKIVAELRRLWSEGQHIPGIPLDGIPDLNSCLLYQQLQVFNCCVSRDRRRALATETLDCVVNEANSSSEESAAIPLLYARISTGELVLRLGADRPADDLAMLETGEPVYCPITQEGPLLTEDLIRENEEFVLRTGSVGAGCSQLLSDMQAFKAANPGCILEDFVRWHSPPDWTESEASNGGDDFFDGGDASSTRGQLSRRMQKEGNLWIELWETAKPVPAFKQAPLFDEDLAVEGILNHLEDITPAELFEQLFVSLLGLGFVMAEANLPRNNDLSKLFYECKDFVIAICQGRSWSERVDDLSRVYETVEKMLLNPEELLKTMKQAEETTLNIGEPKRMFKKLNLNFISKDRNARKQKDEKHSVESPTRQPFSNFFDGKSSLFSKKPPKPESSSPDDKTPCPDDSEWTIV